MKTKNTGVKLEIPAKKTTLVIKLRGFWEKTQGFREKTQGFREKTQEFWQKTQRILP